MIRRIRHVAAFFGRDIPAIIGNAISRAVNVIFFDGDPYLTLSQRAFYEARRGDPYWRGWEARLDLLFALLGEQDHCARAWAHKIGRAETALRMNAEIVGSDGEKRVADS